MYLSGSFVLKAWFYGNLRLYQGSLRGKRDVLNLTRVYLCSAPRSTLCSQVFSVFWSKRGDSETRSSTKKER